MDGKEVVVAEFRICKNDYHVADRSSSPGERVPPAGINRKLRSS